MNISEEQSARQKYRDTGAYPKRVTCTTTRVDTRLRNPDLMRDHLKTHIQAKETFENSSVCQARTASVSSKLSRSHNAHLKERVGRASAGFFVGHRFRMRTVRLAKLIGQAYRTHSETMPVSSLGIVSECVRYAWPISLALEAATLVSAVHAVLISGCSEAVYFHRYVANKKKV